MAGQIINRGERKWLVRVFLGRDQNGKREYYNETVHGSKKDAQDTLNDALRNKSHGKIAIGAKKRTVGVLLDDLLREYRINGQSIGWATIVVEKHLRPAFGVIAISKFTSSHRDGYITKRQTEARNATINRELSLLRRAFVLGSEHEPPKVRTVPRFKMLEENNVRRGFFEHEDYVALLKTLPEKLRPVLTFAYFTGCRKGEILSLRWGQVDLLEQEVRLEAGTTKNDEPRVIPLAPQLHEVLKMQKVIRDERHPGCPCVFFDSAGEPIRRFGIEWIEACKLAKLWNAETKKPTKLFHDLRRSGVRNLVRSGVPEAVAMRISGHKTRSVFERYNIVSGSDLKTAAQKLGRYIQDKANVHATTDPAAAREKEKTN